MTNKEKAEHHLVVQSQESDNPTVNHLREQLASIIGTTPENLIIWTKDEASAETLGDLLDSDYWFISNRLPRIIVSISSYRENITKEGVPIGKDLAETEDYSIISCIDLTSLDPHTSLQSGQIPLHRTFPAIEFAYCHPLGEDIRSRFLTPTTPPEPPLGRTHIETLP